MKEEYTCDTYPSIGKKYNGEKAIISLTSWKARINTVGKTLFSLIKQCPGFHIVLVLSEEEFPLMEKELPKDLMLFVNNKFIEILWVYKNYKAFKKVLFTMDKYRDVPVISADDDCIYTCNYAQELYQKWIFDKNKIVCNSPGNNFGFKWPNGPYTLYPPYCFNNYGIALLHINEKIKNNSDDAYYGFLIKKLNLQIIGIYKKKFILFHDNLKGISDDRTLLDTEKTFKDLKQFL